MTFKPQRDSRPLNERSVAVQMEAVFHQSIQGILNKKQQGYVMGEFRKVRAQFMSEQVPLPLSQGQELVQAGLLAIVDTARKAFVEGYQRSSDMKQSDEMLQWAWEQSEAYAACVKAVEMYAGRKL
ncbi:hypothetical protein Vid5_gp76 [Pantoea phage vB_PagS_Vid5]|uniref:Uncharacterized protein n=1 Tax=Pantoea phage vB_PagS_Vid5 TaxID=2099652 RepID=A0A2P1CKP2_9CAUD|nr:hypothetical protein FDJ45_gp079 [Pantoea phage vB_PagS_Vid5]AVJ51831.1 hypothetical protein Vid5_gp76 [Pantoea phage vB_PagS_Vid5]